MNAKEVSECFELLNDALWLCLHPTAPGAVAATKEVVSNHMDALKAKVLKTFEGAK
jgi:hypothetical protein